MGEIVRVEIADLQLATGRWAQLPRNLAGLAIVEIESGHGPVRGRVLWLLDDGDRPLIGIQLDYAISFRIIDPAGEDMAYAHYLVALSYYDQIDEVGRDQGLTFLALQGLRVVIEQYPDSEYAKSAMLKFDLAFDHLAAKEMEIGRYYLKKRQYSAALNRFRNVVQDYQNTAQTAEALERLVECYLALGLPDEAQTAGAILGYNYQSSPFYEDSFALLKGRGLEPKAKGNSWLASAYRQMIKGQWL